MAKSMEDMCKRERGADFLRARERREEGARGREETLSLSLFCLLMCEKVQNGRKERECEIEKEKREVSSKFPSMRERRKMMEMVRAEEEEEEREEESAKEREAHTHSR